MTDKSIIKHSPNNVCRICQGDNLDKILDFGNFPLAGAFLKKIDFPDERYYPLDIYFCNDCYLVQVGHIISADVLFKEHYFFFSSAISTLVEHFKKFAQDVYEQFLKLKHQPIVLEIGCNDGVLLKPLSRLGVRTIGVDPATTVVGPSIKKCTWS